MAVNDPSLGAVTCPTPASPGLAPGASETCTANETHTVTQSDVDAGKVTDTATATGTPPTGPTSPPSAPSTVTTLTAAAAPAVSLVKTGIVSPAADQAAAKLGDSIRYSFELINTGNVTLASVAVSDPTGGAVTCPTPAVPGLVPRSSTTCIGDNRHLVSQADLAAGKVTDTATATGTDTRGSVSPPSNPSTATIPVVATSTSRPGPASLTPHPATTISVSPTSEPPTATDHVAASLTSDPSPADSPDPTTPTTVLPDGLGMIGTDLGRWIPGHHGLGQFEGGLGLILAGGVVVILRRRRRSAGSR